jgi:hypothetical protein
MSKWILCVFANEWWLGVPVYDCTCFWILWDVKSGSTERQPCKLLKQIFIVVRINTQTSKEVECA